MPSKTVATMHGTHAGGNQQHAAGVFLQQPGLALGRTGDDLRRALEGELAQRRYGAAVRLETSADCPQAMVDFYARVLGFRLSDWIGDYFAFMRCGVDHHTVNFVIDEEQKLHHIAFEVKDVVTMHRACDFLAKNKIQLVWGPIRHIVGHNVAAYHRNPDEIRVELFAEMDLMKDEELGYWEPRPWHEEKPLRPKVWGKGTLRSAWGFGSFGTFPGYP